MAGFALLAKQETLEFFRAHQCARHGCGHAELDQEIDEYQPLFEHRTIRPRDNDVPGRDQASIVAAACCKSCSTLLPAGTPPCAKSRLPPPRPPTDDKTCLRSAPMSAVSRARVCAEDCAKTRPGGSMVLATSATAGVPAARHLLRKQLGEADVAIRKRPHD